MDPQQRMLLELSYDAIRHANYPYESLQQSNTGVFVGISSTDYAQFGLHSTTQDKNYFATGSALSIAYKLLSYFYYINCLCFELFFKILLTSVVIRGFL